MGVDVWIGVALAFGVCSFLCVYVARRTLCGAITMGTFALHVTVAGIFYNLFGLSSPDARFYQHIATLIAEGKNLSNVGVGVGAGKEGYLLLLGGVYGVLGVSPLIGLLINSLACALTVPMVAGTAHRLGASPQRAALLFALFPPTVLWGSLLLREAVTWLLLAVFVWSLVRLSERVSPPGVATALFSLGALLWVRGTLVALVAVAGLIGFTLARRGRGMIPMLAATGIGYVILAPRLAAVNAGYSLEQINQSRSALSRKGASAFATVDYADPMAVLREAPKLLARVMFGPFPWEWPGLGLTAAFSTCCWLLIVWWTWRARRRVSRQRWLLLMPAAGLLIALALTSGNYGTMDRLRVQAAVMLMPVAAAGMRRHPIRGGDDELREGRAMTAVGSSDSGG
jgi:hypothetical protein